MIYYLRDDSRREKENAEKHSPYLSAPLLEIKSS